MVTITFELKPETVEQVDSYCETLGLTRNEYFNFLFSIENWAVQKILEGRVVQAFDTKKQSYAELDHELLRRMRNSHYQLQAIINKKENPP